MQSLRQCWTLGTRMSTETCAKLQRRWTRWLLSEEKRVFSHEKLRKRLISVTGAHSMNRVFCVSRVTTALCWKGSANAENSVVLCWRKPRNREWSVNVPLVSMKQC